MSWFDKWILPKVGAWRRHPLEAPSSWVIVGCLVNPLGSPLYLFSCLFPGLISVAPDVVLILVLLTPEGNNMCLSGSCRADPSHFMCPGGACPCEPAGCCSLCSVQSRLCGCIYFSPQDSF